MPHQTSQPQAPQKTPKQTPPRGLTSSLLRIQHLGYQYNKKCEAVPVFEDLTFTLDPGEHLALLGPSGCGKSSLLHLLCGLDAPTEGEIFIENALASRAGSIVIPPHQRGIGMVFQELALWPNLSTLDNILLGIPREKLNSTQRIEAAHEAIRQCQLDGLEHRRPSELSIGQQQRVALARALAPRPRLLLLDEPFTGLDLTLKKEIFEEIHQLIAEYQLTLLLVTHDPSEAYHLTQDVIVLENGVITEWGKLQNLLESPTSKTLKAFKRCGTKSHMAGVS